MKWRVLILLLISDAARASVTTPVPVTSAQAQLSTRVVARVQASALQMKDAIEQSYCTVFPVTRDGLALTALHCVRGCLRQNHAIDEASNQSIGLQDLMVVHRPVNPTVQCSNLSIPALGLLSKIEIVATGPGLSTFDARFLANSAGLFDELDRAHLALKANDFALIRVHASAPMSCLKLDTSAVAAGSSLDAIGFPQAANGDAGPLSVSHGQIYRSVLQSRFFARFTTRDERNLVLEQFGAHGIYFSNASNSFGQSGGPVFGHDGRVIGLVSGFANSPTGRSGAQADVHELVAVSTRSLLARLPRSMARALVRSNQSDCE